MTFTTKTLDKNCLMPCSDMGKEKGLCDCHNNTTRQTVKLKCYIAGKIGNLPEAVYLKNFNDAKAEVEAMGYEAISPTDLKHNHDKTWLSYMREDVTELLKCNAVYALSNWHDSPGARIEVNLALSLNIPVIFQSASN